MSCIWKMRSFHKTPDDDLLIVRFRFTSSLSPVQSGSSRYRLWYRNECVCARFFKNGEKNEGKKENFRWIYWTTIELVLSCGRQTSSNVLAGCAFHWMRPKQRKRVCFQYKNHTLYLFWILCVLTFIHRNTHTHTHLQHNFIGNEIKCCCWVLVFFLFENMWHALSNAVPYLSFVRLAKRIFEANITNQFWNAMDQL